MWASLSDNDLGEGRGQEGWHISARKVPFSRFFYESMNSRQMLTEREKMLMFDAGIARSVNDESELVEKF